MKQIIPFKKDIIFKTKIEEITSISLEHSLKLDNDNFITGELIVSGDYKPNESSNNIELFNYTIPFDIALDNLYILDTSAIDIEDFYYEIINDNVLRVNIEISIEGEQKKQESIEDIILNSKEEEIETMEIEEEPMPIKPIKQEDREEIIEEITEEQDEEKTIINIINSEEEETFVTYYVHIVKENDDMESILKKYNITKEEFLNYNSQEEIVLGNKLIIPATKNE